MAAKENTETPESGAEAQSAPESAVKDNLRLPAIRKRCCAGFRPVDLPEGPQENGEDRMNYDRDRLDALRSFAINLGLGLIEQKSCVELRGRDGVLFRRCYTLAEIEAALDFRKKVMADREPEARLGGCVG